MQGKVNCGRVYSAYTLKPVLFGEVIKLTGEVIELTSEVCEKMTS